MNVPHRNIEGIDNVETGLLIARDADGNGHLRYVGSAIDIGNLLAEAINGDGQDEPEEDREPTILTAILGAVAVAALHFSPDDDRYDLIERAAELYKMGRELKILADLGDDALMLTKLAELHTKITGEKDDDES